jgi:succinate dehydrogenase / fumarate reductase cytochrome b subunit
MALLRCNKLNRSVHSRTTGVGMTEAIKRKAQRPGTMRLVDALQYRLPLAGLVSILHRASGALLFALLPFIIWMFDTSLSSEISHSQFIALFLGGIGFIPGWIFKLIALSLIWAYLHHFIAGLRHLWMDATHSVGLEFARQSAIATLALSVVLTLALGIRLFF